MMKRRLSERGFTLVEVMLAAAIAAFALCGILATYAACFNLVMTSKNASIATSAAQGLMDEIRNTSFPLIQATYNNMNFTVNNMPSNTGVVSVNASNPELLTVTISVSWKQRNVVIAPIKLTTLIADRA